MSGILASVPTSPTALVLLAGKASLLLILTLIIRFILRTASASTRCFQMSVSIIMIGCLPLIAWITPDWKLPVPTAMRSDTVAGGAPLLISGISSGFAPAKLTKAAPGVPQPQADPFAIRGSLLLYLWLLGTAAVAGRVLLGMAGCVRRQRQGQESDSPVLQELVRKASGKIGLYREIAVRVGGRTRVPHVSGVLRPVLHLPLPMLDWPRPRVMSVLLHELAHIRRGDHFLWPLANLAVSWFWFNPLVWVALAQMRKDTEKACDDYVVACGRSRIRYAQHLLEACLFLRPSARWAPLGLPFARRNEVQERIEYMLSQKPNRRPIRKSRQLAFVSLLLIVFIPLTAITGFSAPATSGEISSAEREAVVATLKAFYGELSNGSDFQTVRERFLTSDYFDDPGLTLENLDRAVWLPAFENTLCCIAEGRPGVVDKVRSRIVSVRRDGDELVAALQLDITGYCLDKRNVRREADSTVVFIADKASGEKKAIRECPVTDSLSQQLRFRLEDDVWKISQFNDGVAIMRMDTDNAYGPIFLVWIENIDQRTTPYGARVLKVIPRDVVPDAHNAQFLLEE